VEEGLFVAQRQVVRHCATAVPQPEKRQLLVRNRHWTPRNDRRMAADTQEMARFTSVRQKPSLSSKRCL